MDKLMYQIKSINHALLIMFSKGCKLTHTERERERELLKEEMLPELLVGVFFDFKSFGRDDLTWSAILQVRLDYNKIK